MAAWCRNASFKDQFGNTVPLAEVFIMNMGREFDAKVTGIGIQIYNASGQQLNTSSGMTDESMSPGLQNLGSYADISPGQTQAFGGRSGISGRTGQTFVTCKVVQLM